MLQIPGCTSYFGAVGVDAYGEQLGLFTKHLLK
jgi:hypothetical protein